MKRIVVAMLLLMSCDAARAEFNVVEASIADMQQAMASGRVTSRELVQQYLLRIALYDKKLNAVITVNPNVLREAEERDRERTQGRLIGPLHGIPIAIKDNIHTTNMPTTGGALAFAGYTPPYEAAQQGTPLAARYPLALIAGANHYFLNSLFANVASQRKRSGRPAVRIHPDDAAPRGLETGHEARIFNDRGAFVALVEVTDGVRPGVVASTKGQWPRFVPGGATVNATVDERDSDMGGGAVFHDNRVQIERL